MKIAIAVAVLFASIGAAVAQTHYPQGLIQHVIIVVQENRTPDNLFHEDAKLWNNGNGAHVRPPNDQGPCKGANGTSQIPLQGFKLGDFCWDPDHSHFGPVLGWPHPRSWVNQYDNGAMDGACTNFVDCQYCKNYNGQSCPSQVPANPQYTYASNADTALTPLFNVAEQYGFANWMFQTNQGPSFPAHQFLFSGTSAPESDPNDQTPFFHQWFVAENPSDIQGPSTGCTAYAGTYALQITPPPPTPFGSPATEQFGWAGDSTTGPLPGAGYPCYHHNSLPTLLDGAGISWRYYSPNPGLWNAPLTNWDMCKPDKFPQGTCNSTSDYAKYVSPYTSAYAPGKILTDLGVDATDNTGCKLQQVSWVIPDGNWSDHPGATASGAGPSWVASIVNAVGGYDNDGQLLKSHCNYWANTVVVVVWDDWGGFYDDVPPPDCTPGPTCIGYSNSTGQQYVYGFRVPMLVVSAYGRITGTCTPGNPCQGYISGPLTNPNCSVGNCHDFGSILNFIEYTFGSGGSFLGGAGGISPNYLYADVLALDGPNNCSTCTYSLQDFFDFVTFGPPNNPRTFVPIAAPLSQGCFIGPPHTLCFAAYGLDPDDDATEH